MFWPLSIFKNFIWTTLTTIFFSFFKFQDSSINPKKMKMKSFNPKIGFGKYAPCPEILVKIHSNLAFQAKCQKFLTFFPISLDPMHIFPNRFLRWNLSINPKYVSDIIPYLIINPEYISIIIPYLIIKPEYISDIYLSLIHNTSVISYPTFSLILSTSVLQAQMMDA